MFNHKCVGQPGGGAAARGLWVEAAVGTDLTLLMIPAARARCARMLGTLRHAPLVSHELACCCERTASFESTRPDVEFGQFILATSVEGWLSG